jgi:TFIIF-interacting CTD phosphatase-like protein
VKDLRLLGRDIKKTIIIDNLRENFWSTCPHNGIEIVSWYGDDLDDTELQKLIPFLIGMVKNEERDIRKVLHHYRNDHEGYLRDFFKSYNYDTGAVVPKLKSDVRAFRKNLD